MKYFICVGHAYYKNGAISSADGTQYGGINEYEYNKTLAPYIVKWIEKAGHQATLCIAPEKKFSNLTDEINYFIGEEHKQNYDLSIQLHLNASENHNADGCEAYAYSESGLKFARDICKKLEAVWDGRGAKISTGLYWTRKTKAKAVLIESFFCDYKPDCDKAKKLGFDAHAKLIAEGMIGQDIKSEVAPPVFSDGEESDTLYRVQLGLYKNKANALETVAKAKAAGLDAIIKTEKA